MLVKIMNLPFMTLLLLSGCCVSTAYANVPFKKVSECQSDYFNGNYCSPSNISKYKTALKNQKANFDKKYILLNTGTVNALEMIALDTQSGIAYPLNYQFTGWEDNQGNVKKKPSYTFSLNDPKLCLMGSQFDGDHPGTHETYSNIRNCFTIQKDRTTTSFESTYTDKVQYEYDEKNKTWTPYPN
jgi:hypothetical protein